MWDTICNLPLDSDLISLATHPTEPVLAIGLAAGHVQVFRIPSPNESIPLQQAGPDKSSSDASSTHNGAESPRRSSLTTRASTSPSPSNGYGCMSTLWKTRRHKGSCRALAFSPDGSTLFSVGTDSLLKAAHALSGHVFGKIALPSRAEPNVLCALSNDTLLLGDDEGGLHIYTLTSTSRSIRLTPDAKPTQVTALVPNATPDTSSHPHESEDDPSSGTQPITSITPLPATSTSTSGMRRSWITTSGGTLAASDIRRGLLKLSIEQGGSNAEELLSSACAPSASESGPDLILAADSGGLISVWPRGSWEDRAAGVRLKTPPQQTPGIEVFAEGAADFDNGIECLAVRPAARSPDNCALVACGLAAGAVRFVRLLPEQSTPHTNSTAKKSQLAAHDAQRRAARARTKVLDEAVQHDEHRFDGVEAVAFDVSGRLITGGGALVKVWGWTERAAGLLNGALQTDDGDSEGGDEDGREGLGMKRAGGSDDEDDNEDDEDEEDEDDDEDEEDAPKRKRKKRRRRETTRAGKVKRGARGAGHGISAISGLD